MEFSGIVQKVIRKSGEKKDGSGTWESVEIWVEEASGQYPQSAVFKLKKDLQAPSEGDMVDVKFSMSAKEWQDRVFGENYAYKVEVVNAGGSTQDTPAPSAAATKPDFLASDGTDGSDDLPF